jgi:2-oxoglutarate ferredoxin oxidoreductase subunit beta
MKTYGLHGVHGRPIPIATGLKLARPDLTVFAMGGDGDLMSIGAGHLPHAAARNIDLTVVMMDNQIYGLTKAQASPTTALGQQTGSTPFGVISQPLKPVLLALTYGATFVARGYSAKANDLSELLVKAIEHKGFAFVHVQSPCTEFHNTYNLYDDLVDDMPEGWDTSDKQAAINLAATEERVHLGVFHQEQRPIYEEQARHFVEEQTAFDMESYLQKFA